MILTIKMNFSTSITGGQPEQGAASLAHFCVQQAADCIFWLDPEGRIIFANPKACDVLEYSSDELQAMTVFDIDTIVSREFWGPHWEAIREKKSFVVESRHRTKTGRTFPVEIAVNYMTRDGKEYNCAFARDITDRKRAEEMVRASEEKYRTYVNNSPTGVFVTDSTGRYLEVNASACRLLGYSEAELTQMAIPDIVAPEHATAAITAFHEVMQTGSAVSGEFCFVRKDGSRFFMSVHAVKVQKDKTVAFCVDVTARRNAEQTLRQYSEALRQANQKLEEACARAEAANCAKSEFLANMSHEIRTPMTAIIGYADVLLDSAQDQDTLEAVQIIKRNGHHLLNLINDILDLSKIEAGKHTLHVQTCSPRQVAADVLGTMRVRAEAKGLRLTAECEPDVPMAVKTDPVHLRQILVNLIGNAVKFTEVGGVRIVMRLDSTGEGDNKLLCDVIDTGIGISAEDMGQLFRPFSQVDGSARRRFGGTGLGLAISKRLAGTLGGDLVVRSSPGMGSTFSLSISIVPCDGPASPPESGEAVTAREFAGNGWRKLDCRILLAEDGADNRRLIAFFLRKAGADVELAEDGRIALGLALAARQAGNPFDAILMDIQMPVMDGYEATRKLRDAGCREPIIALTAHAMSGDRQKCINAGCDDYISKPIDPKKLVEVIGTWVGKSPIPV